MAGGTKTLLEERRYLKMKIKERILCCTQFLAGFKGTEVFPTTCRKLFREIDVQLKSIDEIYN